MRSFADKLTQNLKSANRPGRSPANRLTPLPDFGHNPGALEALAYVPDDLAPGAPLVVVLHGCTQTAAGYDVGAGWSDLADHYGFALLFPQQARSNNPNLCFNWFLPQDSRRDRGEALSIRNMVAAMVTAHGIDPARIFITGLSAGGAMASVMLATYPEVFAGGAIIGGLPYGTTANVPQALERMRGQGLPDESSLGDLVRKASDHQGPWPLISIWHGTADMTVSPANAGAVAAQWRAVHGIAGSPRLETVVGYPRRVWRDQSGRDCVEYFEITGMGHGTPLATTGEEACGHAGAFMLEAGISSSHHICRFWGLAEPQRASGALSPGQALAVSDAPAARETRVRARTLIPTGLIGNGGPPSPKPSPVGQVIEDALRAAGLMR